MNHASQTPIPRVSVLMPTWNRAALIGESIESVLAQTVADLELIIVDDGSTDETIERIRSYRDSRIRLLRQDHAGISSALNRALRTARGRHVARLDSDDIWRPSLLEVQLEHLDAHPEIGVVYAKGRCMDEMGRDKPAVWGTALRFPSDTMRSLLYADPTCNITVVARKACYDRVGAYDEDLSTSEDWDMWVRMAAHFRFMFVDQVLARIRQHEDSTTAVSGPSFDTVCRNRLRVLDKAFADPELSDRYADIKGITYSNVHTINGLLYWNNGDRRRALKSLLNAVLTSNSRLFTVSRIAWFWTAWMILNHSRPGRAVVGHLNSVRSRFRRTFG